MKFVYPPTLDWSHMFQRPQQLARALARRGHEFFYAQKNSWPGQAPQALPGDPGVVLVHDWEAFLPTLGQGHILFASWAKHHDIAGRAALTVFDYLDGFPEWAAMDKQMLAKADLVIYTAAELAKSPSAGPKVFVPNACDFSRFQGTFPEPAWMKAIPRPRVLFSGWLGSWIDTDLIFGILERTSYHWVLVGGGFENLRPHPRLHTHQQVPYDELPAIFSHCDAGMVPFKRHDPVAIAADPIKQYEYLAAGLPTIATAIPEARRMSPPVLIAHDHAEAAYLLTREIEQDTPERRAARREVAEGHDWSMRAERIEREIAKALRKGQPATVRTEKPRVAILTPAFFDRDDPEQSLWGGGERYLTDLHRSLSASGYLVEAYQPSTYPWTKHHGEMVVHGLGDASFEDGHFCGANRLFSQQAGACDHHIYLDLSIAYPHVIPGSVAVSHGIWWDYESGLPGWRTPEWLLRLKQTLAAVQAVVSCDTATINWVRATWPRLASKFRFVPNHVDTSSFRPAGKRPKSGKLTVIVPRRLDKQRGFYLSLAAAEAILARHANVDFLFVGRGTPGYEAEMKAWADTHPRARYLWAQPEEMPDLYRQADIGLIPTLACEGTGYSAIEALASGLAVVATHVGGLGNVILDGHNGLLIEPTAEALIEATERIIVDADTRRRLQANARESAVQSFGRPAWERRWKEALDAAWA